MIEDRFYKIFLECKCFLTKGNYKKGDEMFIFNRTNRNRHYTFNKFLHYNINEFKLLCISNLLYDKNIYPPDLTNKECIEIYESFINYNKNIPKFFELEFLKLMNLCDFEKLIDGKMFYFYKCREINFQTLVILNKYRKMYCEDREKKYKSDWRHYNMRLNKIEKMINIDNKTIKNIIQLKEVFNAG